MARYSGGGDPTQFLTYMYSDALAKGLPAGKKWLKLDLKAAGAKQGVDIAQLQSLAGQPESGAWPQEYPGPS